MSAVSTHNVTVALGGKTVLHKVDFEARAGEVTGVIGPNGAGKSTLLRTMIGLLPHTGFVEVEGKRNLHPREKAKKIAYLPQLMEVFWPLPAESIVALGRYPHGGFFKSQTRQDQQAVEKAMKAADAWTFRGRNILSLSAGERARVLLARALAVEAPVLLADEPVAALDPEHQLRVMETLKNLAEEGVAVVIVLHDLTLATRFCDQLTLFHQGNVVGRGNPHKVLTRENLKKVYKITAKRDKNFLIPWSVSS